jgi:two-component system sensor histidine kinase RpfC
MNACMNAGADAYITKPIDSHNLLEHIANLVRKESTSQEAADDKTVRLCQNGTLDRQALDNLANLGSGIEFVADLIDGFSVDSTSILKQTELAIEKQDYLGFRETVHALKGGAAELGGIEFVQLCNKAEKLKPYEMTGPAPIEHLGLLQQAHARLLNAMHSYLSQERSIK